METIVAASGNRNKIREISEIMTKFGFRVLSRGEAGVPGDLDIVEDGETFEENSRKKARVISDLTGMAAVADDSGLMVDALDGRPGVYSARFSGEHATDEENNRKLLSLLEGVPAERRTARFVSVITLVRPGKPEITARGECPGVILTAGRGTGGFGYDPLFLPGGEHETFAELSAERKNEISHRARALRKLAALLEEEGTL